MNKYIESITSITISVSGLEVRVWREEVDYKEETEMRTHQELLDALLGLKSLSRIAWDRKAIADVFFEVDRVNAVEVKNKSGDGVVLYKNWP